MALRMIEVILNKDEHTTFMELAKSDSVLGFWQEDSTNNALLLKVLLSSEKTEAFLDDLEKHFSKDKSFRVVVLPVEATLPRYQSKNVPSLHPLTPKTPRKKHLLRTVSREELRAKIHDGIGFTALYVAMVILSSTVATIGLLRDSVAVVIGAMVIAPFLGPNVGLAFATTLGDQELGRQALRTIVYGMSIALTLAVSLGFLLTVNPEVHEIASRTDVNLSDIMLALASGCAGVLAFANGTSTALIGVMVAVALLPPLVTFGILTGSGHLRLALQALLLLTTNLICINFAGVVTFQLQGIRPQNWLEAVQAQKLSLIALLVWSTLLIVLILWVIFSHQ